MSDSQAVIYVAATLEQALLLENALREQGIAAEVTNEPLQSALGQLPYGTPTAPRVVVGEADAQNARRIALEFEEKTRRDLADADKGRRPYQFGIRTLFYLMTCAAIYAAVEAATAGTPIEGVATPYVLMATILLGLYLMYRDKRTRRDKWESQPTSELAELEQDYDQSKVEWPRCPTCNRPRHTSCPVCQTAGSDFAEAFVPGKEQTKLFVLCPTCDEAFEPEFLARCEWCGHPFADGRELPVPAPRASPFSEMTVRAWIVLAILAIVVAALVGLVLWRLPRP